MCASLVFQVHQAHTSGQIRIIFHLHLDFPEIAGVSFPFQKTLPKLGVQMDTLGGFRGPPPRIPVANVRFRLGFPKKNMVHVILVVTDILGGGHIQWIAPKKLLTTSALTLLAPLRRHLKSTVGSLVSEGWWIPQNLMIRAYENPLVSLIQPFFL